MRPDFIQSLADYIALRSKERSSVIASMIEAFFDERARPIARPDANGACGSAALVGMSHSDLREMILETAINPRGRIPTYLENLLLSALLRQEIAGDASAMLSRYVRRLRATKPRFMNWEERTGEMAELEAPTIGGTELDLRAFLYSQGAGPEVFTWKGVPCLKTVYDIALYMMLLAELRPRTILELGAGCGGSALLLADLSLALSCESTVHSIDSNLSHLRARHPKVHFHQSDCLQWLKIFRSASSNIERPCVVIEDFHCAEDGFFVETEKLLNPGDYLIVEDSLSKQAAIRTLLSRQTFKIDTKYTDFFGVNCTSAVNGILRRV